MFAATKHHVEGIPLPDPLEGKDKYYPNYVFNTSRAPGQRMAQEAHYAALKKSMQNAEMTNNGQVTHKPRHEQAVQLRTIFSAPAAEIAAHAGWNYTVMMQFYAQLPSGDLLAHLAGCGNRQYYMCVHGLLDPCEIPAFQAMVDAFYPGLQAKLKELKQVMTQCKDGGSA